MEAQEEIIIKKKRSKRPRAASSLSLTLATSSCSTAEGSDINSNRASASPSSSGGLAQEEEDMAKCLILLAQGHAQKSSSGQEPVLQATQKAATIDHAYQCKTCNRCFPSFQALGGHRASHKKPKPTTLDQEQKRPILTMEQESSQFNVEATTLSLQIPSIRASCSSTSNKIRVHECSICRAEFNSGQALGGHMRRHRPIPMVPSNQEESQEAKKPRTLLSLDLNLPAPEDDHLESKFPFPAKEQVIVFSASPLIDCHY